jgi:hypothetical protein
VSHYADGYCDKLRSVDITIRNGDQMKGSVPRPPWPAPVAKATTRSASDNSRPKNSDLDTHTEPPIDPSNRITLAVLEEFSAARMKGYDPYNTSAAAYRPADAWQRKRKGD